MTKKEDPNSLTPLEGEEEITQDIATLQKGYGLVKFQKLNFGPGKVLTFDYEGSKTILEVTRVVDGHWFAKHIELHEPDNVISHYHHKVDQKAEPPFCWDCDVPVTEPATLEGKRKYEARKDRHFSDGTPINDVDEDDEPELPALV